MPVFTSSIEVTADYPTIKPSLNLNFARARALDPRITFTRASVGTYVDRDGLIKTAGNNEARFDHDPITLESLGLLIEESRTNLVLHSDGTGTGWTGNGTTRNTITTVNGPDGVASVTELIESNSNAYHAVYYTPIAVDGSSQYTVSIWLKKGSNYNDSANGSGAFQIYCSRGSGVVASISINSNFTTFSSNNTDSSSLTQYQNGWIRAVFTFTSNGAANVTPHWLFGGGGSYQGNGTNNVYMWGAQVEKSAFPTSYIPTSGSSVTREPDSARISGESFKSFHNYTEHSLLVDYVLDKNVQLGSPVSKNLVGFFDAGSGNYNGNNGYVLRVVTDPTSPQIDSHGNYDFVTHFDSVGFNLSNGVNQYKVAMGFALNDQSFVSGSIVQTDTSVPVPNTQTVLIERLVIGSSPNKVHYKKVVYYSKRLTNAQLQALTQ